MTCSAPLDGSLGDQATAELGLVWFAFHLVAFIGGGTPFVWWVLAAVLVAVAAEVIVARWMRHGWTARHRLAASFGAVLAAGLFGLLLVSGPPPEWWTR